MRRSSIWCKKYSTRKSAVSRSFAQFKIVEAFVPIGIWIFRPPNLLYLTVSLLSDMIRSNFVQENSRKLHSLNFGLNRQRDSDVFITRFDFGAGLERVEL